MAKDAITSPLRAPFTRFERPAGEAELMESVRGHGLQHAAEELASCRSAATITAGCAATRPSTDAQAP